MGNNERDWVKIGALIVSIFALALSFISIFGSRVFELGVKSNEITNLGEDIGTLTSHYTTHQATISGLETNIEVIKADMVTDDDILIVHQKLSELDANRVAIVVFDALQNRVVRLEERYNTLADMTNLSTGISLDPSDTFTGVEESTISFIFSPSTQENMQEPLATDFAKYLTESANLDTDFSILSPEIQSTDLATLLAQMSSEPDSAQLLVASRAEYDACGQYCLENGVFLPFPTEEGSPSATGFVFPDTSAIRPLVSDWLVAPDTTSLFEDLLTVPE